MRWHPTGGAFAMSAGKIVLALDGMGGDHAPDVVVNGADIARERYPGTSFLLFGDPARLKPLVDKRKGLAKALEIVPAEDAVLAEDKPSLRAAPPPQVEHVAGRRGRGAGPRRYRRLRRQHRRAAGHLDVRHAHARRRAPAGARLVPADGARRDGDARSRRQPRMRRREPRRVRRHGQRLRPGAARPRPAQGRPAERRLRGAQGPRGAAPGGRLAAPRGLARRLPRLRRGQRHHARA